MGIKRYELNDAQWTKVALLLSGKVGERMARGEFDLIAVGRALLADAQRVSKMRDGRDPDPFHVNAYATLD